MADDQAMVREGIVLLLGLLPGIEVVGAVKDGAEAVAMVAAQAVRYAYRHGLARPPGTSFT